MSQKTILSSDSGNSAAGKINDNFTELYGGQGGGQGGSDNTVIGRNQDAVQRIYAAKKHVIESGSGSPGADNIRNAAHNFCIAHGSDFHADLQRWKNFLEFAEGVDGIQAILCTGDFAANLGLTSVERMTDELDDVTKPIMLAVGNHDRYGITNAQLATAYKMDERNNDIVTDFTPSGGTQVDGDANCLYYYVDFDNKNNVKGTGEYSGIDKPSPHVNKLRFIVLNQYDMTSTDRSKLGVDFHYTQDQIDWFIKVLENTPNTTGVIVCMHGKESAAVNTGNKKFWQRNFQWGNKGASAYSGTIIEDIIEAFRTGTNIDKDFSISNNDDATVSVETNFSAAGSFICYMVGHAHHDQTGYSYNHPNQLYLMCPCSCLQNDWGNDSTNADQPGVAVHSFGNDVGDMPRVDGTKTQDCFNVYGIDTISKRIRVVRVGSTVNDLGQPKDIDFYPYEQAPS